MREAAHPRLPWGTRTSSAKRQEYRADAASGSCFVHVFWNWTTTLISVRRVCRLARSKAGFRSNASLASSSPPSPSTSTGTGTGTNTLPASSPRHATCHSSGLPAPPAPPPHPPRPSGCHAPRTVQGLQLECGMPVLCSHALSTGGGCASPASRPCAAAKLPAAVLLPTSASAKPGVHHEATHGEIPPPHHRSRPQRRANAAQLSVHASNTDTPKLAPSGSQA